MSDEGWPRTVELEVYEDTLENLQMAEDACFHAVRGEAPETDPEKFNGSMGEVREIKKEIVRQLGLDEPPVAGVDQT